MKKAGLIFLIGVTLVLCSSLAYAHYNTWEAYTDAPGNVGAGGGFSHKNFEGQQWSYTHQGGGTTGVFYHRIGAGWGGTTAVPAAVSAGGAMAGKDKWGGPLTYIYGFQGGGNTAFWFYNSDPKTWSYKAAAPDPVGEGGSLIWVGNDTNYYIYALRGNNTTAFWRYSPSTLAWETLTSIPDNVGAGGALEWDGSDCIYALVGGGSTAFWRYSISGNNWTLMASVPSGVGAGGALLKGVASGAGANYIYASRGDNTVDFYRYSIYGNRWETLANAPASVGWGASMTYSGSLSDAIFVLRGNGTKTFWRYHFPATIPPPSAPSGATLEAITTSSMRLKWTDNSNTEEGFRIERSTSETWSPLIIATVEADVTSYETSGLSLNTRYFFRVYAYSTVGPSNYSTAGARYTLAATPESLATVEVGGTYDPYIKISWSAGANLAGTRYAVERAPDVGGAPGTWTYVATWGDNITAATYTDTGLNLNTGYWHRVRAYNGDQILTGPGNTVSAKTPLLLPIVTTLDPTGITSSETTLQGSITSTGGENCSERGFEWGKFSGDYTSSWTEPGSFSTDPFTRTISVNPRTRYFYRAKAPNSAGWGYGPETLFTTLPYEPFTQTRYYRSDTHTVNGLGAYKLQTTSTEAGTNFQGENWYDYPLPVYYWSDVYIRHSDGSETALGTEVAQTYRDADGEGYQSAAWSCPQTALSSSDAIRITEKIGGDPYGWLWSERDFIIEPLGSPMLLSGTWTFTRYTYRLANYYLYDPEYPEYGGYYQILGRTYHGSSAYNTRIEEFSYQVPFPPPSAPSGATLEAITTSSMRLKWTDNSADELGFRIYRATNEAWTPIVSATVEADVTSYEASGLSPNIRYFFRVCAYNAVGPSDYSTAGARYSLAATPEVTVLGDYDSTYSYHCDITVNPKGNPAGTYYAVYSSEEAKWLKADGTTTTEAFWQTTTSWFHKNLSLNTTYSYKVKAKNGENVETSLSAAGSGTPPPPSSPYKTKVGSAESWEWRNATPGESVPSGTPSDWLWRTWEFGSTRKVPSGEARDWIWGDE